MVSTVERCFNETSLLYDAPNGTRWWCQCTYSSSQTFTAKAITEVVTSLGQSEVSSPNTFACVAVVKSDADQVIGCHKT